MAEINHCNLRLVNRPDPSFVTALQRRGFVVQWVHPVTGEFDTLDNSTGVIPDTAANVYAFSRDPLSADEVVELIESPQVLSIKITKSSPKGGKLIRL